MSGVLRGKVALVTGAGAGIGRASALAFASAGARVVAADVDVAGGQETAEMIRRAGAEVLFVQTDVTSPVEVDALIQETVSRFGRLDCAHNNAGILGDVAPLVDSSDENFDRVFEVNVKGVWLCLKAEIRQMLAQGGGAIVNTASSAGLKGSPTLPAYSASKHAVVGLTKSAALAYARQGIRVNAVCPGYVDTDLLERLFAAEPVKKESERAGTLLGRFGTPEEIAQTVVWLCSDAASLMTAHALPVGHDRLARRGQAARRSKEHTMTEDLDQIRAWLEEFAAAVRAVDYDHGRSMFAPDVVGFGTYAGMLKGLDALMAGQWRNIWGVTRGFTFRLDQLHAGVSGDQAWIAVPWDSEGQRAQGEWFDRPGRATIILERRDGRWLARHTHFSLYPATAAGA